VTVGQGADDDGADGRQFFFANRVLETTALGAFGVSHPKQH
jgi:hypothetical protein